MNRKTELILLGMIVFAIIAGLLAHARDDAQAKNNNTLLPKKDTPATNEYAQKNNNPELQKMLNELDKTNKSINRNVEIGVESESLIPSSKSFEDTFFHQYYDYLRKEDMANAIKLLEKRISFNKADPGIYYMLINLLERAEMSENPESDRLRAIANDYKNLESTDPDLYKKNIAINKNIMKKIAKYVKEAYDKYPKVPSIIYIASKYLLPSNIAKNKLSAVLSDMNEEDVLYGLVKYQLEQLKSK